MKEEREDRTEEKEFTLRAYTKAELAQLYSPGLDPILALQKLYRWMRKSSALSQELDRTGYNKHRHSFLKREVKLIIHYLGEP